MNRSTSGLPVHHQLLEFTQTHAHRVGDAIQPPLSSPSPPAPNPSQHQGLFQWVNSLHEVVKILEFQLQHQSFQWTVLPPPKVSQCRSARLCSQTSPSNKRYPSIWALEAARFLSKCHSVISSWVILGDCPSLSLCSFMKLGKQCPSPSGLRLRAKEGKTLLVKLKVLYLKILLHSCPTQGLNGTFPSRDAALRVFVTQALETEVTKTGACPPGHTVSRENKTGRHHYNQHKMCWDEWAALGALESKECPPRGYSKLA